MTTTALHASLLAAAALLTTGGPHVVAQSFVDNPTDSPQTSSDTEQIDFADVDLDGDWDCALANGGNSDEQNELWINQGGLQAGAVGTFLDETAARLPAVLDPSRDVEFADVDADGDPDLYVLRHAQLVNVGSRWWINQGGEQPGALGYFQDETAARWIGLGAAGSSIHPSLLLADGGWIDWSNDGDFADLDGDGDLDLVHSSYGNAYGGKVPVRIFLNDGDGRFTEFNPSGFQLGSATIQTGEPALWCQGVQQDNTADVTGAFADVADAIVDLEVADVDGDLDCDILWGTRAQTRPRFFRNLLDQGALAFRDESALAFPGIAISTGAFEQELGDLDEDGDLDLYGLNWLSSGFSFPDLLLENQGGVFGSPYTLPGSEPDEEEGDFLDFDGDGDLDLFVANFSGSDELYENTGASPFLFLDVTAAELPALGGTAHDCEVADVDLDGDYDVFVANTGVPTHYFENVTGVPDSTRPRVPLVESVAGGPAAAGALRVRAHVYDNAPYYTVWYDEVWIAATVDGIALSSFPMRSSGGQVFRGELPAHLVGAVSYRVRAADGMDNVGQSQPHAYVATGDAGVSYGTESAATGAAPPDLRALSEARSGMPLFLAGEGLPLAPVFLGVSAAPFGPAAVPGLANLVLNVDPGALLGVVQTASDQAGTTLFVLPLPGGPAGVQLFAQYVELAPSGTFGGSQGLQLTIQ
jgi:hypothetical protein